MGVWWRMMVSEPRSMIDRQENLLIITGSSVFSNFTMGGNFLLDINDEAAKLRDSGIEQ